MKKTVLKEFENFDDDKEEYLKYAWISFTVHLDKPRGLWFAYNGQKFLDNQIIKSSDERDMLSQMYRKGQGYHIVAMVYLWNNWFDEAFELENYFLSTWYWQAGRENIEHYLEMLLVKRRSIHLGKLFDDASFQYAFFTHFEVFCSLFLNPNYTIVKMGEFISLINKVNKLCIGYGEPDFIEMP